MSRNLFALLLFGLSTLLATAQSQPIATPDTTPLVTALLPFVDDENFGKELKMSPDQLKKLIAHRQKQWDEAYTSTPVDFAKGHADRDKATVATFKDVLDAGQYKRVVQLAAQSVWINGQNQGFGGSGTVTPPDTTMVQTYLVTQYSEIADALNLNEGQKKFLTARANVYPAPSIFLTPEQSKAAKELLGEPRSGPWKAAFDPRTNSRFAGGGPFSSGVVGLLGLTEAKDVRTEIGLTDEQIKALAPAQMQLQTYRESRDILSPEAQAKKSMELNAQMEKILNATLKPEQLSRLRQIDRQQSVGRGFPGNGAGAIPLSTQLQALVIRNSLAFTSDQEKKVAAANKAYAAAIAAAVATEESVEEKLKAITAAGGVRDKEYLSILTAEQTKALPDVLGKPFTGTTWSDRNNGPVRVPGEVKMMRSAGFGKHYLVELSLLAQVKSIQDELKLLPEQVKKATAALEEFRTKFPPSTSPSVSNPETYSKAIGERSAFIVKTIGGILTAEQTKRYREIMLQRAETTIRTWGLSANVGAIGYPGVADAVKLTDDQKTKILDGDKPDEVLTAQQKFTIKVMQGTKFEGSFTVNGRGPGTPGGGEWVGPGGPTTINTTTSVLLNVSWDVFQATPDQAAKLVPVMNEYQLETMPVRTQGGDGPMRGRVTPEILAAANEKLAKSVAAILKPEQAARIEQVRFQLIAASSATFPLGNREVAEALDLSDEQRIKVYAILSESQRLQTAVRGPVGFRTFGTQEWLPKLNETTTSRLMAVLTSDQKAAWKKLTGEPVPNLASLRFGLNGPGGGFPGGGF